MATFNTVIRAIRDADAAERARQLTLLLAAFVPPDVEDPQLKAVLDVMRASNPGKRRKILDQMVEQFVDDNPDDTKPKESAKNRGRKNLLKFLRDEKKAGRPRPNRKQIEAKVRQEERISQRELDKILVDDYEDCAALGLVKQRA